MSKRIPLRSSLALLLTLFLQCAPLTRVAFGQQPAVAKPASTVPDFSIQLAAIEKAIDDKRIELGIPGLSLVIVKDDRVIYMKGLGVKDLERKLPVTPNTLFAIGSATKAFTAMTAMMTVDQGRLSLDDPPNKYLPYFTLRDPEAAAKITLRDLLSHRSGLNRTDLAMVTNKLNREELIRVAGLAKPTAKLGEKFQYQNVMYAAAGEVVATIQHSTWDKVISTMIFKPLAMKGSDTTVESMLKAPDFSYGYEYNSSTKQTRRLPQREIPAAAPAGAINSNARDMAQWLRFLTNGGAFNGRQLVSQKNFNEVISKQINVAGTIDYGLGWFLRQWNGHKVAEHGGNIDGFNSQVAFMPDQKLGFALLTNVTASSIGPFAMNAIWKNLVAVPGVPVASGPPGDPKQEVGSYLLAGANTTFEIILVDGKLRLKVPGQPEYPLENVAGRRYKLGDPAPAGFFATFRPVKDKPSESELYLEQPQGNLVLSKVLMTVSAPPPPVKDSPTGPLGDLVGSYESESSKQFIEIGVREGKVSLVVPGQPPYPLAEEVKNKLRSPGLPETYWIDVNRDDAGRVAGIVVNQPEGRFTFRRVNAVSTLISADDLITKMVAAYGGETNLRKHKSSVTTLDIDLENQGVLAQGVTTARAPNMTASNFTLTALGKTIGSIVSYFDGNNGGEIFSFGPEETYTGRRLEDVKIASDFYEVLNWKKNFKTITVKRMTKLGDEDVYVVEKRSEKGTPVTDYVSAKTYLVLRRDSIIASDTSGTEVPQTESFSDYRMTDGIMIPFQTVANNIGNGNVVTRIKEVKFDVELPDSVFSKPAPK